jgi:hypothetical protein
LAPGSTTHIRSEPLPAAIHYLFSEGILGAGGSGNDCQELRSPGFRYGLGAVSKAPGARVKWNVEGRQFTLWSPHGPEFGKAQVKGRPPASRPQPLRPPSHSRAARLEQSPPEGRATRVALTGADSLLAVDSIEVIR